MGGGEEEEEEKYMCRKESEWEGGKEVNWRNELSVCARMKGERRKRMYLYFLSNSLLGGFDGMRGGRERGFGVRVHSPSQQQKKKRKKKYCKPTQEQQEMT